MRICGGTDCAVPIPTNSEHRLCGDCRGVETWPDLSDYGAGMCSDGRPCGAPAEPGDEQYCMGCPNAPETSSLHYDAALTKAADAGLCAAPEECSPLDDPHEALTFGPLKGRAGGLKFDADKPRMELLMQGMPRALEAIGQVLTFGAQKYEAHSWQHVEDNQNRYWAAKVRHDLARAKGEKHDEESGLLHLAHEACCVLFLLELTLMERDK